MAPGSTVTGSSKSSVMSVGAVSTTEEPAGTEDSSTAWAWAGAAGPSASAAPPASAKRTRANRRTGPFWPRRGARAPAVPAVVPPGGAAQRPRGPGSRRSPRGARGRGGGTARAHRHHHDPAVVVAQHADHGAVVGGDVGFGQDLGGRAPGDDDPALQEQEAIGELAGQRQVVHRAEDGQAVVPPQPVDELQGLLLVADVERARWARRAAGSAPPAPAPAPGRAAAARPRSACPAGGRRRRRARAARRGRRRWHGRGGPRRRSSRCTRCGRAARSPRRSCRTGGRAAGGRRPRPGPGPAGAARRSAGRPPRCGPRGPAVLRWPAAPSSCRRRSVRSARATRPTPPAR